MKTLGICLGASTISVVEAGDGNEARLLFQKRHEGCPRVILEEALTQVRAETYAAICATGRKLRGLLDMPTISEPEATEYAVAYVAAQGHRFDTLVSCGAETFIAYGLDHAGKIAAAHTSTKCASGTGEFFLQQIRRMGVSVEEALRLAEGCQPFKVSGRCSVFCKSDCTHALNHGEPLGEVVAGLCQMMSEKIVEIVQHAPRKHIAVVGGVARNAIVIKFLRQYFGSVVVPVESGYFEALGAALRARAHPRQAAPPAAARLLRPAESSFGTLPALSDAAALVSFKSLVREKAQSSDRCVMGLDVGSTTTKAVVLRLADTALVASVYLKTNGRPVEAARNCYRELLRQLPADVSIIGMGVTGSGRQIAGLHALTPDIINEIIAHARAAVYFDKDVDVIFEIGGQDAKYTYLVNGVPCDYAMNEACSAGTGSFLEEAGKEIFGIEARDIAELALQGADIPNFSDQCAAFISSDIQAALQEGITTERIVAGLVYSVCMNYINRVKGTRPDGSRIFMQGGVCYNRAVPLAMAGLLRKPITVPPEPGLMGAFGAALEVAERLRLGLATERTVDLTVLMNREVEYGRSFVCAGDGAGCDRNCSIVTVCIEGRKYPFGGVCNKYYNMRFDLSRSMAKKDVVIARYRELFKEYEQDAGPAAGRKTIGLNLSFITYSLLPLYYAFFQRLGYTVVLPVKPLHEGFHYQGAAFCYPAALAHGFFLDLLNKKPDYVFLPQVAEMHVPRAAPAAREHQSTCFLLQAEPYFLKTAFKEQLQGIPLISPKLNFSGGYRQAAPDFVRIAGRLGVDKTVAVPAYEAACQAQDDFTRRLKQSGAEVLRQLSDNPDEIVVVVFGRPYNAFCPDMNMGIPNKFATRGITVVPFDALPYEDSEYKGPAELCGRGLTWAFGRMILRAASYTQQHAQCFGVYITNFSCGPDSFLLTYFREIMKEKPSLTIEIDSHTADAGINTRVEAFLDIVQRYRQLQKQKVRVAVPAASDFQPARVIEQGRKTVVVASNGRAYPFNDRNVRLLIPSMGDLGTQGLTAVFNRYGINAAAMPVPDAEVLKCGRSYSSGKECLPLTLTCGGLMKFIETEKKPNEVIVYFMPTVSGNCRFSQYSVFTRHLIEKHAISDVAVFSLTSENSYAGLGHRFALRALKAVVISDVMDDIRNALAVLARDQEYALSVFTREWQAVVRSLRVDNAWGMETQLRRTALALKKIPLRYPLAEAKVVSLLGEIFIRKEVFSRRAVVDLLNRRELIIRSAPVLEWLYYVDYLVQSKILSPKLNFKTKLELFVKHSLQYMFERRTKNILAYSGLCSTETINMATLIKCGSRLVPLELTGEPIIVMGSAIAEILHTICGVVAIGPFNCLPTRFTEAVLSREMHMESACMQDKRGQKQFASLSGLPFLTVEIDGNPLSGLTEARLEAFCLQAEKVHRLMHAGKTAAPQPAGAAG